MIGEDDLQQMQADLAAVRDDAPIAIQLRRGDVRLPDQTVRLTRGGSGSRRSTDAAAESRDQVLILGAPALNIALGDRFTTGSILYRVTWINPDRRAATQARADVAE